MRGNEHYYYYNMSGQGSDDGDLKIIDLKNINLSEAATRDNGEGSCERKRSLWRRGCASPG